MRAAAPDVEVIGFGIPALVEWEAGVSRWSNHLPLDGVPFRDLMSERLGMRVLVDNDGNASMLAEARHGAAAGARHAVMISLGTGIGGGLWLNGEVYRGATGVGGEMGHSVLQIHGPDCPGDCPGIGCFEALVSGTAIGREGLRRAEADPDSALGRRLASEKEITGGIVTEMAHDGDPLACEVLAEIGERLGFGLVGLVNTFNPEVIVIGGGAVRARRAAAGAGADGDRGARAAAGARGSPARARPLRRRGRDDRRGADGARVARMSGRLVVCPTPIGNLEDVTLRVLSALREADVVACEDTRRTRVLLDRYGVKARLVSYHEHNEKARAAELVGKMRDGAVVALVSDAGMPLVSDPGYLLVRGCVAAGLPVEVLPGPSAAITALVASGLPADEWHFHGFLPRKKGELRELLSQRRPRDAGRVRVPAPAAGDARAAGRARSGARGRGLPRADEGARGDRARHRRRAGGPLRRWAAEGRDRPGACTVGGSGPSLPDPKAVERAPQAGRRGRPPAEGGVRGRLPDRLQRKFAVPRAHLRVTNTHSAASSIPADRPSARTVGRCAASCSHSPPSSS